MFRFIFPPKNQIVSVDSQQDSLYNHSERKGGNFHRDKLHEKPVIQVFEQEKMGSYLC